MKKANVLSEQAADLRRSAEKKVRQEELNNCHVSLSKKDEQELLHELRVHQVELEMQNEELRRTNAEIDAARARYFDLYDMAPVGYCTLSDKGLILEANFTAAAMLGVPRGSLIKQPITRFIFKEDQDTYYLNRKMLVETGKTQAYEIRMWCHDGTFFWAYLMTSYVQDLAAPRPGVHANSGQNDSDLPVCRIVLTDITGTRHTEKMLKIQRELLIDLNACNSLKQGLEKVLNTVLQLECIDSACVYLADPADGSITMVTHRGLSEEFASHVTHFSADSHTVRMVLAGKSIYGKYSDIFPNRDEILINEGLCTLCIIPIISQGQLIAVINLASHNDDSIPPDTRKSLEIIAFQIGGALLRLRTETALKENEEIFKQFMDNSPIYVFFKDNNIRPLRLSSNYEKMLGKPIKDLLGKTMDELFPSELAKSMVADDLRILKEGKQITVEEEFNGRVYSTIKFPIHIEGKPRYLSGYTTDITDSKLADDKLRDSEEKYRSIVNTTTEWIWEIDINGKHTFSNPKINEILGIDIEEMIEKGTLHFIHPDDRKDVETNLPVYIASKKGWRGWVLRWRHKDGSYRYLESNADPIFDKNCEITGYRGADRDITGRRLAEEKRLEMERHLLHAQKLESLGLLAGGIAHDFNNLLGTILGNIELAMEEISPASNARPFLESAFNASRKSAALTRQMLAYSGKGGFVIEGLNISELVQENFYIFRSSIPRTITMSLHLNADIPHVLADSSQIQQVIMNLITNAAEAIGDSEGIITLSTGVQICDEAFLAQSRIEKKPALGKFIYLEVTDTGCGMNDETLNKLFDPFYTTKISGRGLGMAALQGIIKSHDGAILVESILNQGTSIRVLLPVIKEDASASIDTDTKKKKTPDCIEPTSPSGLILIVDDDKAILKLCTSLVSRFGYSVLTASDGKEAIEVFRKHNSEIACVILDLTMPKMDGAATFNFLKEIYSDVKVILSSGYSEKAATERFAGKGLAGFIQKPYGKQELQNELIRVLKKKN